MKVQTIVSSVFLTLLAKGNFVVGQSPQTMGTCFESPACTGSAMFEGELVTANDCHCAEAKCFKLPGEEEVFDDDRRLAVADADERGLAAADQGHRRLQWRKFLYREWRWRREVIITRSCDANGNLIEVITVRVTWIIFEICYWRFIDFVRRLQGQNEEVGGRMLQDDIDYTEIVEEDTGEEIEMEMRCTSSCAGEPHIKQLAGGTFDYQGQCDLVLSRAPAFADGLGLEIHGRTQIESDYSYIESCAIRLGEEVIEIGGWGEYILSGVDDATLPSTISGFSVTHYPINTEKHRFLIDAGAARILITTVKGIVSFEVLPIDGRFGPTMQEWFGNSTGLIGSLKNVKMMARDGVTAMLTPNEFGQEWQVQENDPKLFQNPDKYPQYPEKCILPSPDSKITRRLGEGVSQDEAERVCGMKNLNEESHGHCVYDVVATADVDAAETYY